MVVFQADLPEHLSKHCLREWMKQTFKNSDAT